MLDGPGPWHRKASAKTQVSLTRFLQSEVKIIHIIVQDQDGQNNNINNFTHHSTGFESGSCEFPNKCRVIFHCMNELIFKIQITSHL